MHRAPRRAMRALFSAAVLLCCIGLAGPVVAQERYPDRPLRLVVGYAAGGGVDAVARLLAPRLAVLLKQEVIVDNRAGATGTIAAALVARAKPDGYTLFLGDSSTLIAQFLQKDLSFDPLKSFVPVAGTFELPLLVVAANDFPARDPQALVATLKARPGFYTYATSGNGTVHHLGFTLFETQAGVKAVHVPYRGASQILSDVISGQVTLGIVSAASASSLAKGGKLRAIATMSRERLPSAEEVAPLAAAVPGFDAVPRLFLAAPAGTPQSVVEALAAATKTVLAAPDMAPRAAQQGAVPAFLPPDALARSLSEESARWGKLIRDNGITGE